MAIKIITGIPHTFFEQGMESAAWAIQDFDHIDKTKLTGQWSYDGLNIIRTGDWVVLYKTNKVLWGGIVLMEIPAKHNGRRYNGGLPINCDRDLWIKAFYDHDIRKTDSYYATIVKQIYKQT